MTTNPIPPIHPPFRGGPKCIKEKMPAEEYHAFPAVSAHGLMAIRRSAAHYLYARMNPKPPSDAKSFGTLTHFMLLEPEVLRARFVHEPVFMGLTKEGKESTQSKDAREKKKAWHAALAPDAIVCTPDDVAGLMWIIKNLRAHPTASQLLREGAAEVSGFAQDPVTGYDIKCRWDFLRPGYGIDVKTCKNASYEAFHHDAYKYGYDITAAQYLTVHKQLYGEEGQYVFIAIENEPPHEIAVYLADPAFIEKGHQRRSKAILRLTECIEQQRFPGYDTKVQPLGLPHRALYDEE